MSACALLIAMAALQQEAPERPGSFEEAPDRREALYPDRLGPFTLETFSPLASFRSGFTLQGPSTLGRGMFEARASQSWADVWALNQHDWRIDYEGVRTDLALSYGLSRSTTITLRVDTMRRTTGDLDGFILDFHEAVGAEQRHRDEYPSGEIHIELPPEGGQPGVDLGEDDLDEWTQSAVLTLERRAALSSRTTIAAGISFRREMRNVDAMDGGLPVDLAVSAAISHNFGDFSAYLAVNLAWFGKEELAGLELRPLVPSAMAGLEWRCLPGFSLVFQYALSGGVLEELEPFDRPTNEVAFGFKWEIAPGVVIEAALLENLIIPDNSADFGARLGLAFRW